MFRGVGGSVARTQRGRAGDDLSRERVALREEIAATTDFQGIIGTLTCDEFGDCGTGRVNIYYHADSSITDVAQLPVEYQFAP